MRAYSEASTHCDKPAASDSFDVSIYCDKSAAHRRGRDITVRNLTIVTRTNGGKTETRVIVSDHQAHGGYERHEVAESQRKLPDLKPSTLKQYPEMAEVKERLEADRLRPRYVFECPECPFRAELREETLVRVLKTLRHAGEHRVPLWLLQGIVDGEVKTSPS